MSSNNFSRSRGIQKAAAIGAAGLVVASGIAVASLAAWTDTEWVQGGVGTVPGISTSTFAMQQNTTTGAAWVDEPEAPGGIIAFVDASGLTPGDTAYGFVRLRTTAASMAQPSQSDQYGQVSAAMKSPAASPIN